MEKSIFKNIFCLAICLAFLIVCVGCASAPAPVPPEDTQAAKPEATKTESQMVTETYFTHVVKWPGESLSIIAGWYTGDIQNWKTLAEANPDINPNRIHEGMKLRILESMMKTKAPLTKEYVDSYYPAKPKKASAKSSSQAPARDKDEEPVLFGPKQYPAK